MTEARALARQELHDLWVTGRGLPLMTAYALLLSVTSYFVASNRALNFLEQREAVALTLQVAVAVAALMVLVASADAVSGERERGTLEPLLLAPAPRWSLVVGKGVAALSLWLAAVVVAAPYVGYLGRGTHVLSHAAVAGAVVSLLLSLFLCGVGLAVSTLSASNRSSLSVSFFLLLAVFVPTQLPTSARQAAFADFLLRFDPVTAGLHYLSEVVTKGHGYGAELGWMVWPVVLAPVACAAALVCGQRIALRPRGAG